MDDEITTDAFPTDDPSLVTQDDAEDGDDPEPTVPDPPDSDD